MTSKVALTVHLFYGTRIASKEPCRLSPLLSNSVIFHPVSYHEAKITHGIYSVIMPYHETHLKAGVYMIVCKKYMKNINEKLFFHQNLCVCRFVWVGACLLQQRTVATEWRFADQRNGGLQSNASPASAAPSEPRLGCRSGFRRQQTARQRTELKLRNGQA